MYTNADMLTTKMPELNAQTAEHLPLIIAVTKVMPKNYRIHVQTAGLKVSDDHDVFPDEISCAGEA